jgi:outer membrane protein TolC
MRRLSVDEAVTLALEQNLDLQVERLNPRIQDMSVAQARSVYTPVLSSTFTGNNENSPAIGFLSGAGDQSSVTDRTLRDAVDLVQEVPWAGGRYTAAWDGSHRTSSSVFFSFAPILQSNLSLNYTQPLLRNLAIDTPRWQIAITRANREMSDIQLRATVVVTQRNVRNAYWGLVSAQSFLAVQRQSLELSQESLRNNRTRVEVGTMAPIDIVEAESEVARNEENVIIAEAAVERAEDLLRTLIFDPDAPDFWSIQIQPSDEPMLAPREIDVDAAIRHALSQRTDLDAAGTSESAKSPADRRPRSQACLAASSRTTSRPGPWASRCRTHSARAQRTPISSVRGCNAVRSRRGGGVSKCGSQPRSATPPARSARISSGSRRPERRGCWASGGWRPNSADSKSVSRAPSSSFRRNAIWRKPATEKRWRFSTTRDRS